MNAPISRFRRRLLILMITLYLVALGAFSYANWHADPSPAVWQIAATTVLLSLPLVLFFGAGYLLISAWREHHLTGGLPPRLARIIHWAPRAAAIAIIFFVTLFSLDVFEMEATLLELVAGFLIHSLPSIVMAVMLVFAWRRPAVGFVAFLLAGLFFLGFVIALSDPALFLLFSGPILLISGLFYADWRWSRPPPDVLLDAAA